MGLGFRGRLDTGGGREGGRREDGGREDGGREGGRNREIKDLLIINIIVKCHVHVTMDTIIYTCIHECVWWTERSY